MFGLHKLYSKQSLLRFLWKKVHRLEKSTPTPLVALQTNISYVAGYSGDISGAASLNPRKPLKKTFSKS